MVLGIHGEGTKQEMGRCIIGGTHASVQAQRQGISSSKNPPVLTTTSSSRGASCKWHLGRNMGTVGVEWGFEVVGLTCGILTIVDTRLAGRKSLVSFTLGPYFDMKPA